MPEAFSVDSLTDSQKTAVFHKDGPLLVLAGPGSGKTRVITSRIAALIDSGVRPWNICAITFTNKAAEEMKLRLEATGTPDGVYSSTFHSLCVRILRKYAMAAQISSNFSIYDQADQRRVMKEAVKKAGVDSSNFPPARMLDAVGRCKNDLEGPDELAERADEYFTKTLAKIYKIYQDKLTSNNALDFDDLLVKTALLLRDHPDVREELSNRFKYLLVDEYQDTNHAQYQIAKGLALAHGNICVTGDPDQSIYGWRGADIANILAFEEDWPNAVVVKLEENFRSSPQILELADKLIASNTQRKKKRLVATLPDGSEAEIKCHDDEGAEAQAVAQAVKELLDKGTDPNEIAVFYRVNSMSRSLEEGFVNKQVPYQVVRGVEFYSRKEIRDLLSYLKLIVNPQDDAAFLRAIATHPRGIGKMTLERLASYAVTNHMPMIEAAGKADAVESIAKATRAKLRAFAHSMSVFAKDAAGKVAPLMTAVFEDTGLAGVLRNAGEERITALENVGELINAAEKYDQTAEEPSLVDYLQSIALYSDTDAYDAESAKVSLMTLHAAKGLEFDNAFIIGVEEGILPHDRSLQSGKISDLEEERRLLFVGITRARKQLSINFAKYRLVRGQFLRSTPSQFLYEIGFTAGQFDDFSDVDEDQDWTMPGQTRKKAPGKEPMFVAGQLVEHKKFGMGRVKEFLDIGESSIVVVRFNSGTTKSLMVAYANLTKIG